VRFVLVHGALHGAWCWEKLVPELEALGQFAVTVDLPGRGERVGEVASLDGWRDAIVDVLEDGDVLAGHSVGCWAITLAADAVPDTLRHVVYFAGGLPFEGRSIAECVAGIDSIEPDIAHAAVRNAGGDGHIEYSDDGSSMRVASFEAAREHSFHDCTAEDALAVPQPPAQACGPSRGCGRYDTRRPSSSIPGPRWTSRARSMNERMRLCWSVLGRLATH
jgi:pimeloyl-ACP methyl ester carboxylesterase